MANAYTPADGLKNLVSFPADPADEAAARKQIQDMFDQILAFHNTHLAEITPHGITRNLSTNGFVKVGGAIIQWGKITCNATPSTASTTNLNIAFPTAFVSLALTADGSITSGAVTVQGAPNGLDKFNHVSSAASQPAFYIAIGY